jgi:hypothetical protein
MARSPRWKNWKKRNPTRTNWRRLSLKKMSWRRTMTWSPRKTMKMMKMRTRTRRPSHPGGTSWSPCHR